MPEQESLGLLNLHALKKDQLKVADELLLHLQDALRSLLIINSEDSGLVRNSQESHPLNTTKRGRERKEKASRFDRKMPGCTMPRDFFSPNAPYYFGVLTKNIYPS